ncbi:MAG: tRNA pseudouridine(55) synthase TruB [Desulfuromonadales bacterium]
MHGVLIIDKPADITSHDVVRRLRRLLKIRRIGHAGTLDPMATGVLQVAVGEGTRLVEFLMQGEKTYRAVLRLGETTDTQDAEGKVVERRPVPAFGREEIDAVCRSFTGRIRQIPPMYSALKKNGVSLHRLARQGIEVEREAREIEIRALRILAVDLPLITLEVDCSKGTYIRTLAHDIGAALGPGAHLTALRRLRSGSFTEADSISLDDLEAADPADGCPGMLSLLEAMRGYPRLAVNDNAASRLQNGVPPKIEETTGERPQTGECLLLLHREELLAVARFDPDHCWESRGDFALQRVFPHLKAQR